MVSRIVTTIGRSAIKKIGNTAIKKTVEKFDKPYSTFNREIFGIKSLNVGEHEELDCYRQYPNASSGCVDVGNKVRNNYHNTGKYNPYSKKK